MRQLGFGGHHDPSVVTIVVNDMDTLWIFG
jgi:hypothetical protein